MINLQKTTDLLQEILRTWMKIIKNGSNLCRNLLQRQDMLQDCKIMRVMEEAERLW